MKQLFKTHIAVSIFTLLSATLTFALPMEGEQIYMDKDWHSPYTLIDADGVDYISFCLESEKYFTPGNYYTVESIGNSADGDELSNETKWLYAGFASNAFSKIRNAGYKVQKAIWHLEGEAYGSERAWNYLSSYLENLNFDDSGWYVAAVDIISFDSHNNRIDNQSQLIGVAPAPVPEPATILLFGLGLVGLGTSLRRKQ